MTPPRNLAAPAAFAMLAALAGCAYQNPQFVRYEPAGPTDVWNHGLRLHPARTDSLTLLTGFVDYGARATPEGPLFGSPLTFLILAQNTSRQPVTLDPMRFRLHVPDSGVSLAPLDPEAEVHAAARDMAEEHGRYVRDQWAGRSLRKTTLLPGMRVQGTVSFVQSAALPFPDTRPPRGRTFAAFRAPPCPCPGRILRAVDGTVPPDPPPILRNPRGFRIRSAVPGLARLLIYPFRGTQTQPGRMS